MRLALISDIHGNVEALSVVLAAIDARAPDAAIVCAGDVVGYGPDPEACLELLQNRQAVTVMGNHEQMVLGLRDFSQCVYAGVTAALWTRRQLAPSVRTALEQLPAWADAGPGVVVCHGDLDDANTYVVDVAGAQRALAQMRALRPDSQGLVCGHTHHAAFYTESTGFVFVKDERTFALPPDAPYLVNPGAVGQSRDGTVHASFALLDLENSTVSYCSLPYDSDATVAKLRRAGLVAQVMLERPRGAARRVEHARLRMARRRALAPENQVGAASLAERDRSPIPVEPARRSSIVQSTQRWLQQTLRVDRLSLPGRISDGATVLTYRAITTPEDAGWVDPRFATPVEVFAEHARFLAGSRRVMSLAQVLELLDRGNPVPPDAVVVTFDGAHRGITEHAVPILRQWGLPATVYVATGFVSREKPQTIHELYGLFSWRTRNVLNLEELGRKPISLYDPAVVRGAYLALDRMLITASWDDRERVLAEVRAQLRPERAGPRTTATWDDLRRGRELHPHLDIGVQTRHHVDLSTAGADVAAREIHDSITDVFDALGVEALDLAYPFNQHSYTASAVARAVGLRSAAIIDPSTRVDAMTDRFLLPRVDVPLDLSLLRIATGHAHPTPSRVSSRT